MKKETRDFIRLRIKQIQEAPIPTNIKADRLERLVNRIIQFDAGMITENELLCCIA